MRRPLAIMTALTVGLTGLALSQTISFAEVGAGPTMAPPGNQTAVKGLDQVSFSGSTDAAATLSRARIVWLAAPGSADSEVLRTYETNDIRLSAGQFSGQTTLGYPPDGSNDGGVAVEVTLDIGGGQQKVLSNIVPVDLERPYILKTELLAGDKVRATFSEPVFIHEPQEGADLATDWAVDGYNPLQITGSGAVRDLKVTAAQNGSVAYDQDATPLVKYFAATVPVPGKLWFLYTDRAGNIRSATNSYTNAIDRIAPAVPTLEQVAGVANNSVDAIAANDPTPAARLSGLRAGHVGQLWLESNDAEGFQAGDTLLGESVAGDDGVATIDVAEELALSEDGRYTLYGVARDRAKCWPADGPESAECPNHSAADPAYYELDTVAPKALYGLVTSDTQVDVVFTEYVSPDGGEATQWRTGFGSPVSDVTGGAAAAPKRTLTVSGGIPGQITEVSWDPAWEEQDAQIFGAYHDAAGNALEPFTLTATNAVPPLVTVTFPLKTEYQASQDLFRITGTAEGAQLVQIAPKLDDGELGAWTDVNVLADETWSAHVQLRPNAVNRFVVRGYRTTDATQIWGPQTTVPDIVQDSLAPEVGQVDVHPRELYDGSQGFKGGDQTDISWTTNDEPNFPMKPFKIELSVDGGVTWRLLSTEVDRNVREFHWVFDRDDTNNALVRVSARDEAGWVTSAVSPLFVIDSTLPHFTPKTLSATQIDVLFSESVATDADEVNRFEWRVDGSPVLDAQPQTNDADETMMDAVRLTVLPTETISPNETPCVAYVPIESALEDARCGVNPPSVPTPQFKKGFTDRADNPIEDTRLTAIDAIAPLAPSLGAAPALTGQSQISLVGSAEQDATNEAVAKRSDGKTFTGAVAANGAFTLPVELLKDQVSTFQVLIRDPSFNLSQAQTVSIEQDGTAPKVKIKKIQLRRSGARRIIRVKWDSVDKHRHVADVLFRLRSRTLRIAAATPDDGSFVWRVPKHLRGKRVKMTVITTDLVGNRSQAWSKWVRIR